MNPVGSREKRKELRRLLEEDWVEAIATFRDAEEIILDGLDIAEEMAVGLRGYLPINDQGDCWYCAYGEPLVAGTGADKDAPKLIHANDEDCLNHPNYAADRAILARWDTWKGER